MLNWSKLFLVYIQLGTDEREVLHEFSSRLLAGQKEYGKLDIDTDKRNWAQEAFEEDLDSSVYRAVEIIKRRRTNASND